MAKEFLSIGSSPNGEDCAQVGSQDYGTRSRKECRAYIAQIERAYPPVGSGYLGIKSNPHDFGTYYEVNAYFDDADEAALNWAYQCEADPDHKLEKWDEVAVKELADILFSTKARRSA